MPEEKVEFKWLEVRCIGSDTVVFKLEDEATVKVKVDIERAGKAINFTNPDGTAHYNIGAGIKVTVIPPERKFWVPKSQIHAPPKPSEKPPPTTIT